MENWIEVKARYDKMLDNGAVKRTTETFLVEALSCPEAEARVIKELSPLVGGDLKVNSNKRSNISEVWNLDGTDERFYRVKINYLRIDEKSGKEKREPSFMIVCAGDFDEAVGRTQAAMQPTISDWEIEAIALTRIVDVFYLSPADEASASADEEDAG